MANDPNSMRTPLARVRGLGASKSGTESFWRQRLTAIALLPLSILFVVTLVSMIGKDYNSVHAMIASPAIAIPLVAFVVAGVVHMQIGMQVILEDYVHAEGVKIAAVMANTLFSILVGLAALYAILKIGFT